MSKSVAWGGDLLKLLFQNINVSLIGDATGLRGSSLAGSLYLSLHTSDPGEGGTQTTNESAYGAYARAPVPRTSSDWSVTDDSVTNMNLVSFPRCTGGTSTVTHFGVGTSLSGAGKLLYSGALNSSLIVSNNIKPEYEAGSFVIREE